jgi:hypothetical protein
LLISDLLACIETLSKGYVFRGQGHIYAAMRGESLEDFQKTRNAPGALYSVAGKDAGTLAWSK